MTTNKLPNNKPSIDDFSLFATKSRSSTLEENGAIDKAVADMSEAGKKAGQLMVTELQTGKMQGAMYLGETARALTNSAGQVLAQFKPAGSFSNKPQPSPADSNTQPAPKAPRLGR